MTGTLRKAVAECLATLLFIFCIIGAVNAADKFAPLAIGLTLMVLVYATGHISGGHLNPAVSFGAFLRGAINGAELGAYIVAQLIGAALGALLSLAVWPHAAKPMAVNVGSAFLVEALFTFVLVYVVLNVATAKDTDGNSFYGFAIGMVVFVGASTVGGISGGSFNPAVAVGLAISGQFGLAEMWMYLVAPLVGAAVAAGAFRVLNAHEFVPVQERELADA